MSKDSETGSGAMAAASELEEDEDSDEKQEEMRRKIAAMGRRRTKLDLSAGLTDIRTGNVDTLVMQFIMRLKVSNAETRRHEAVDECDEDKEETDESDNGKDKKEKD